jgi:hypothetical protein
MLLLVLLRDGNLSDVSVNGLGWPSLKLAMYF